MKLKLLFLLFTQIGISQNSIVKELLIQGKKEYFQNNFLGAKQIFDKATSLDAKDKEGWYNLGVSELKLGENENACEHFYQAVLLYDDAALESTKEYCSNFRNGGVMFVGEVDEKPKFIYKTKEYEIFKGDQISPFYQKILVKKLRRSKILISKLKEKIRVVFRISREGEIVIKVIGNNSETIILNPLVQEELVSIFSNTVTYVSAKNKGVNIDLWDKWILPINFVMDNNYL